MMFMFILVGCSDESGTKELIEYDKEDVLYALNKLNFNLEVPNLLPFEPIETKIDVMSLGGLEDNFITISFINENQQEVTFRAGIVENAIDFTEEKIKITENLAGRYGEKDTFRILKWDKDHIYYELLADRDSTSKKEMLKIAKSLDPIN